MGVYLATGGVLLVYLVLAWFLGTWLKLHGSDLWILRAGLTLIGLASAAIFIWFFRRAEAAPAGSADAVGPGADTADLDLLAKEAVRRLRSSPLGRGATPSTLPLVFLLGESGSIKTTTIIHSGLDPELLAGHVYQDNNVVPTRIANIWYTRQALFVDPSGGLLTQPERWKRLVKLVQPGRFSSAMGKRQQAPRAAIVCFDCENFLRPGASETILSAARKLAVRLQEISQLLGISFPVYVLFTKLDRISFFEEFARGLTKDEASEVLGATLPVRSLASGVYAEEETQRLTKAFDELFYSLAEKRLDLLAREHQADKLANIYEFPRELRKLRTLLVQFLVDLVRPSQLTVNPFLRGFYFSGVRPVIVDDVVAATPKIQTAESIPDAGATRIFSASPFAAAQAPVAPRVAGSRKVPQWIFLTQLFNDVIMKDRVAFSASGLSSRVNLLRRILLTSAALIGLVCIVGFLVSFVGNHTLLSDVKDASNDLRSVQPGANQLPSLTDLQKLERLRQDVARLSVYDKQGAPFSLRWGLYAGDDIYPDTTKAYFQRFYQLLFADTQSRLLSGLRAVPQKPGPNDSYETTYNQLKAYLITTSNHEKSTQEFLPDVLMNHWTAGRDIDSERSNLARKQFEFYSSALIDANPFSASTEAGTVNLARSYLSQIAGIDRFYLPIVTKASGKGDISFNERFPNSTGIIATPRVRSAFTRDGFTAVQSAIRNPSSLAAEEWVLGKATAAELDPATLQQKLTERYYQDFVNEWRNVLQTSSVAEYKDFTDAAKKLEGLSDLTSPLLELFWFVSNNTDVGVADVSAPFLPVQAVEPPGEPGKLPDQYILPSNKEYVGALSKLQSDIDALAHSPGDATLAQQASSSAAAAKASVTQLIMGARVDQKFHDENLVRRLLEQPITNVEALLQRGPVDALNAAGQVFCSQFNAVTNKYPFNRDSTEDVSLDQLNGIFAPKSGALWTFYDTSKLAQYLTKQGSHYVPARSETVKLTPGFVDFFNRATAFSDAFYPSGSPAPKLAYALKQLPSEVDGLALNIGNDTLSGTEQQKTFTWLGSPQDVKATAGSTTLGSAYNDMWSIFKFIADAHATPISDSVTDLRWVEETNGKVNTLNGQPEIFNSRLEVSGFNPFRPGELARLRCVSQVAH